MNLKLDIKEESVKIKKKMIALELPLSLYKEMIEQSNKMCLSTSAIVRLALIKYLEGIKNS